jgi:hypothetical protein
MARNSLITFLLVLTSLLLAILLFVAGAIWRGRITSGNMDFRTHEHLVWFEIVCSRTASGSRRLIDGAKPLPLPEYFVLVQHHATLFLKQRKQLFHVFLAGPEVHRVDAKPCLTL